MAASYFFIKNSPYELEIAYSVTTFFQACLQRAAIDLYLTDVATDDIIWSSVVGEKVYVEIAEPNNDSTALSRHRLYRITVPRTVCT
jgi:hypothetical protein